MRPTIGGFGMKRGLLHMPEIGDKKRSIFGRSRMDETLL